MPSADFMLWPDAPLSNPYDPVGYGYGEGEDDSIFDVECSKCRRSANSDECDSQGKCPDCAEAES